MIGVTNVMAMLLCVMITSTKMSSTKSFTIMVVIMVMNRVMRKVMCRVMRRVMSRVMMMIMMSFTMRLASMDDIALLCVMILNEYKDEFNKEFDDHGRD